MEIKNSNKQVRQYELGKVTKVLYSAVLIVSMIFLVYMEAFQNIDVYNLRNNERYSTIQNVSKSEIADKNMPIGVYKEYSWTQDDVSEGQNCLAFYTVHQYVEVYYDGELMYSLKPDSKNRIGKTTASNWIIVPIYKEDEGKKILVKVIPVYNAVRDKKVSFYVGTRFMIYFTQLKRDLPQIILSLLSMAVGMVFLVISMFHKYRGKENANIGYLGVFSLAIGIWKITDIRSAPLIFNKNTEALSYISIMMLLVGVITWILSIKRQFTRNVYSLFDFGASICCISALTIMFLQITNIADFRETLGAAHTVIAIMAIMVSGACVYERKQIMINKREKILFGCLLLCLCGVIIDMMTYYIKGSSAGILYTLAAFLIYIITMGCMSINEINHKANIDVHTGLFNKYRCNEILDANEVINESLGIIMFDLNKLKHTNDTLGHEAGDQLISEFANVLRDNIASRHFVGRYGGDEFIAVIKSADHKKMKALLSSIQKSTFEYNNKNTGIYISYASGYELSLENPGVSLRELLGKADHKMYQNKKDGRETILN